HLTTRYLGVRLQALLHLFVIASPLLVLPIGVDRESAASISGVEYPIPWLLMTLTAIVGLPFFVLSTSAPLLQKWFAATGHSSGRDPYFLYAASNAGSMLALVGYPLLVEPARSLTEQGLDWRWGYCAFIALVAICTTCLLKRRSTSQHPVSA